MAKTASFKVEILENYLSAYRGLIALEADSEDCVTISFPMHFTSNHRIELSVERIKGRFVINDSANTIGQLRDAGYGINNDLRSKLEHIASSSGVRTVGDYLVLESSARSLGVDIQRLLEAAKTIGDVYLVHKQRISIEKQIVAQVKDVLCSQNYVFKERATVGGEIEGHTVDFLIPPNGSPGLALAILAAQNTHNSAQVWGFRLEDIKRQPKNKRLRVGVVYDTKDSTWSEESRRILESRADLAIPSELVGIELIPRLVGKGIATH